MERLKDGNVIEIRPGVFDERPFLTKIVDDFDAVLTYGAAGIAIGSASIGITNINFIGSTEIDKLAYNALFGSVIAGLSYQFGKNISMLIVNKTKAIIATFQEATGPHHHH